MLAPEESKIKAEKLTETKQDIYITARAMQSGLSEKNIFYCFGISGLTDHKRELITKTKFNLGLQEHTNARE